MSDYETPPPADADRTITDSDDTLDPEAPTDSLLVHPPREDADRPVPPMDADEPQAQESQEEALQEENAATSLDQPSDAAS
jgi:hypothetical protein